jgi:Zn finger protein HypA/HybF involved in hydrogenase expression
MSDPTATPAWVVIVLVLVPIGVAGFVGAIAFRRMTPLIFRCRWCEREFRRAAHRRFPAVCPGCGARDWNA